MVEMANRTIRTLEKGEKFIATLRRTGGNVSRACRAEGIGRTAAYEWRAQDADFAREWDEAVEEGLDNLEEEARRRAFRGLKRAKFYQGEVVGYEKEYSDTLLIFLLKGGRPDKYRERTELTGPGGAPLYQPLAPEILEALKAGYQAIANGKSTD